MLLATALALLCRMCSTDVFTVQNKPAAVAPKTIPIISSFLELGRRKLSMQPKFVAAQKMLLKRNPANIRKWIAPVFITLGIYTPLEARVCAHNNYMDCPIDMGSSICTAH